MHKKADLIYAELVKIIQILLESKLVHGDLCSNNLMIYGTFDTIMEPIKVNTIDIEWAGRLGEAYYPEDQNPGVGYPGEAASCIGLGDNAQMVKIWLHEVTWFQIHILCSPYLWSSKVLQQHDQTMCRIFSDWQSSHNCMVY